LPLGTVALAGFLTALLWAYGRYQQKPVVPPARQAVELPGVRPRDLGKYVRVLAIDGGGIRGLLALHCLAYLEERSGRPTCELFDVMVGTGSGAFLVAALTLSTESGTPRFSASDLIKEYPKIWARTLEVPLIHPILSLQGRIAPKNLGRIRQKVFQEFFGDVQVGAALTTIILPAFSTTGEVPFLFASDMGKSASFSGSAGRALTEAGDFFLADAVTAATCNPALSAPSKIMNSSADQTETFVGGEIYANNPTLLAISEALLRYPGKPTVVISLGAGISPADSGAGSADWKKTGEAEQIVRFAAETSRFTTTQTTAALHRFGSGPVAAYIRLDTPLPASAATDTGSKNQVDELNALAEKLTQEKEATLNRTADFLGAQ
jgi:predicted acylesterase/phospholipase RssA